MNVNHIFLKVFPLGLVGGRLLPDGGHVALVVFDVAWLSSTMKQILTSEIFVGVSDIFKLSSTKSEGGARHREP